MVSEDPPVRKKLFRSSIMRNLIEMHQNPIVADNQLVALGERHLSLTQKSISSFIGSLATAVAVTPFDVVKVRLQAQEKASEHLIYPSQALQKSTQDVYHYRNSLVKKFISNNKKETASKHLNGFIPKTAPTMHFTGSIDATKKIIKFEGIRSLWSGLTATLIVSVPLTMIYFPMYDSLKYGLGYDPDDASKYYIPPLAGAVCRAVVVVAFNPFELYRTKLQSEKISYRRLLAATRTAYQQNGIAFLLSGVVPSLLRDVPFSGVYWYLYENLKLKFMHRYDRARPSLLDSLLSGAIAGSVAALSTLPFDVIKTHVQVELGQTGGTLHKSTWQMVKSLYKRSGLRGLYRGAVPRLIKTAPACAIMISTYEGLKTFFIKYNCHRDMKDKQCNDGCSSSLR